MVKRVVPGLIGAVLLAAIGWIGLQYWGADTSPWGDGAGNTAVPPISGTVRNFTPTNPRRPAPIDTFHDADGNEFNLQSFGDNAGLVIGGIVTYFHGSIDEIRVYDRTLTAAWVIPGSHSSMPAL